MGRISVGELVKKAKGEDRSLREYARDSGVDAAILSKMINGTYVPKRPGIYEALTNLQASPRGGVTCEQMIAAVITVSWGLFHNKHAAAGTIVELFSPSEWDTVTVPVAMLAIALIML